MQRGGGGSNKAQLEMSAAGANPNPMGMESSEQGEGEGGGGGGQLVVEAASPISSRPPASASAAVNLDELMPLQGDEVGDEADRAGGAAGGVGGGNRWPRQETLALLRIRSEMDAVFRDATLKGPLWEDVSRKLAELGYKRSAKKCKEKFENVHKYYKRTKEGRAGRQDGKSYKFFSELEALHSSSPASSSAATTSNNASPFLISPPPATTTTNPAVVSSTAGIGIISNPMPISSVRVTQAPPPTIGIFPANPSASTAAAAMTAPVVSVQPPAAAVVRTATQLPTGISFSSNSSSSSLGTNDDDDDEEEEEEESLQLEGEPSNVGSSRKRKRGSSSSSGTRRMMQFFETLMKQVMHKQEVMQQRFLEAIEKREQDRMIRDEAWKRQEMARLAREHEVMAQDRAISASRDAAIVTFLQKITGQTIQLPTPAPPLSFPAAPTPPPVSQQAPIPTQTPAPAPAPTPTPTPTPTPPPSQSQQQQQQQVHQHSQNFSQVVMAVPEQQVPPQARDIIMSGGGGSFEATSSSRWPKVEVLALIKLRSGLEQRYQEAGPKGPLWEEISAGMHRMGYKRNPKRCKEKWENINKYYKKVKESNKKRPEDAKTCPYFHELDALYRKKILGGGSTSGGGTSTTFVNQNMPQQQQETIKQDTSDAPAAAIMPTAQTQQQPLAATTASENKNGASTHVQAQTQSSNVGLPEDLFGEGIGGASKKPEDIVKELMEQQEHQRQQQLIVEDYDKIEEAESDNMDDQEEEEEEEDEDEDDENEELEVERKISYKIEFQRQNTGSSNGGGNGPPSFLALVQ